MQEQRLGIQKAAKPESEKFSEEIEQRLSALNDALRKQIERLLEHTDSWFGSQPTAPRTSGGLQPLPPGAQSRINIMLNDLDETLRQLEEEITRAQRI